MIEISNYLLIRVANDKSPGLIHQESSIISKTVLIIYFLDLLLRCN